MGNAQTSRQTIENIIETHMEAHSIAQATADCSQNVEMDFTGAEIKGNCNFVALDQKCKALANASMDVVIQALSEAELKSEQEAKIKNLALGINANVNDSEIRNTVMSDVKAKCEAEANVDVEQKLKISMRGIKLDCTGPDKAPMFDFKQYGDAGASCVVNTLVDQTVSGKSENKQKATAEVELMAILAFLMPCMLPILVIVVGVIMLPMILKAVGNAGGVEAQSVNAGGGGSGGGGTSGGSGGKGFNMPKLDGLNPKLDGLPKLDGFEMPKLDGWTMPKLPGKAGQVFKSLSFLTGKKKR